MNDISKTRTIERFNELLKECPLSKVDISKKIELGYHYLNWCLNENTHFKITKKPLKVMQSIVNSGDNLLQWIEKNPQDKPTGIPNKPNIPDPPPEKKKINVPIEVESEKDINIVINIQLKINGKEIQL